MEHEFAAGDRVYKSGTGYSGVGVVVARFVTYAGGRRYVVAHKISRGSGEFYHIYSGKQLSKLRDINDIHNKD